MAASEQSINEWNKLLNELIDDERRPRPAALFVFTSLPFHSNKQFAAAQPFSFSLNSIQFGVSELKWNGENGMEWLRQLIPINFSIIFSLSTSWMKFTSFPKIMEIEWNGLKQMNGIINKIKWINCWEHSCGYNPFSLNDWNNWFINNSLHCACRFISFLCWVNQSFHSI